MMDIPNRRWFQFSLRTMFVIVTICGTIGYWLAKEAAVARARRAYERAAAGVEAEVATWEDLCQASLDLYRAEASVPLANRARMANEHLERMQRASVRVIEGPATDYDVGDEVPRRRGSLPSTGKTHRSRKRRAVTQELTGHAWTIEEPLIEAAAL